MGTNDNGKAVQSGDLLAFASRYAWLRSRFTQLIITTGCSDSWPRMVTGIEVNERFAVCDPASVDRAIDAAMANASVRGGAAAPYPGRSVGQTKGERL